MVINFQPDLTNIDGTNYVTDINEDKWSHYVLDTGDKGDLIVDSGSDK